MATEPKLTKQTKETILMALSQMKESNNRKMGMEKKPQFKVLYEEEQKNITKAQTELENY